MRAYVRKHDLRLAKDVYRTIAAPLYGLASIPLYDITASFTHKFTWFRIPKNGTHSIMKMLEEITPPDINSSYVPYFRKVHQSNFRFCVIRNPWDRAVSVYCNKVLMKLMYPECWDKDFSFFIDFVSKQNLKKCDGHLRLQTAMFPTGDVDYVARTERFEEDMNHIMNEVLKLDCHMTHSGAVPHEDYLNYYDDRLRDRVGELYLADIEFGDYRFDKNKLSETKDYTV